MSQVQLAEYRAGSQKALQEEACPLGFPSLFLPLEALVCRCCQVLTRQAIHEERFLRQQRFHEARILQGSRRLGDANFGAGTDLLLMI